MRKFVSVVALSLAAVLASCASQGSSGCADCAKAQTVIDSVAKANPDVTRLTLHCNMGGKDLKVCASTSADKKGKASDPEDKKAIDTNQTVVLEEGSALDVTVPLHVKDGKPMSACGVTLKTAGMTRDQAVAKATQIAKAVEAGLPECCTDCCK